jgi:hypothetical protein
MYQEVSMGYMFETLCTSYKLSLPPLRSSAPRTYFTVRTYSRIVRVAGSLLSFYVNVCVAL